MPVRDYGRFFPAAVQAALAYPPPGAWMPRLPPGCVRLSAGYPFPAAVPVGDLARAAAEVLAAEGDRPLQYLGSPAMAALAGHLRARSARGGMPVAPEELLVTAGACQAIDLAARALLGPDSLVAVEAPTYMEALEIFRNYTPHLVGYPVGEQGLDVEALAADLAARRAAGRPTPRLLYIIASFQNPTGATLPLAGRRRLLALAAEYDFLILEDDAYGALAFPGTETLPALKALDGEGRVIYLGSLAKVVAPGLRVGWAAGPAPLLRAMALFKKDLDHPLAWALTSRYLESHDLDARLAELRRAYAERAAVLAGALGRHMPAWVRWTLPRGGFFIWVHTPGVDTLELLPAALAAGVAYVPGPHFYASPGQGREFLRLSFSYLPPEQLEQGAAILGGVLRGRR